MGCVTIYLLPFLRQAGRLPYVMESRDCRVASLLAIIERWDGAEESAPTFPLTPVSSTGQALALSLQDKVGLLQYALPEGEGI